MAKAMCYEKEADDDLRACFDDPRARLADLNALFC